MDIRFLISASQMHNIHDNWNMAKPNPVWFVEQEFDS